MLCARVAAIDMGSNAIRLRIVEIGSANMPRVGRSLLDEQRYNVRLGLATYGQGRLDEPSITAALSALRTCRESCRNHGVTRYRAVATAALRDAPNGGELVRRAREELGLVIEVIPGDEEARLLYLGLAARDREGGPVAMIELGSGSLQVAAGSGERATLLDSLPLGGLRLALEFGARDALAPERLAAMQAAIRAGLAATTARLRALPVRRLLGAGGGFRAVAVLTGDRAPVTLALDQARALTARLAPLGLQQRVALGLPVDRADSVTPAACLSAELIELLGLTGMDLVDTNVRDGILADLAADPARGGAL